MLKSGVWKGEDEEISYRLLQPEHGKGRMMSRWDCKTPICRAHVGRRGGIMGKVIAIANQKGGVGVRP